MLGRHDRGEDLVAIGQPEDGLTRRVSRPQLRDAGAPSAAATSATTAASPSAWAILVSEAMRADQGQLLR